VEYGKLNLEDFDYHLPEDRIAKYPLKKRDQSKLLVYSNRTIRHHSFEEIRYQLPGNSLLVFNQTRVIPARLEFTKPTGAKIEILLLDPVIPSHETTVTMRCSEKVVWRTMIKNFKKWDDTLMLEKILVTEKQKIHLKAAIYDREKNLVLISWEPKEITFGEILEMSGKVPLPPYLKREPEAEDKERYQTVYSKKEGAVAAPTAGLHFTRKILDNLSKDGIKTDYLTLHVSAGTFQPIRHVNVKQHPMHREKIFFTKSNIENLLEHEDQVIAVGTTSMRILETLYWYGVKLLTGQNTDLYIDSLFPYQFKPQDLPPQSDALSAILDKMIKEDIVEMSGETRIFILPGYHFKIVNGLITNFHMPKSTLILLVAAFIGPDWQKVYQEALRLDYRFLSYGDSSLLLP
jgi:S-adenosylmethionine:tRNA ribosyltransferase-isomerase